MKKLLIALAVACGATAASASDSNYQEAPINTIFGQGVVNPYSEFFTGTSYLNNLTSYDEILKFPAANVTFEPCTRTFWHKHTGGQVLFVLAGEGRHQIRGQAVEILLPGDVVVVPPDVEHWHGAGPDTWMSHLAHTPNAPDNSPVWLVPVTDEEYNVKAERLR